MHRPVWHSFEVADSTPAMPERSYRTAEAGIYALGASSEMRVRHTFGVDVIRGICGGRQRGKSSSGVQAHAASFHAKRIRGTVGQRRRVKRGRQLHRLWIRYVAVIPIGQSPCFVRTAEFLDSGAHDLLKVPEIYAVPRQKEPAAVLTATPVFGLIGRELIGGIRERIISPLVIVDGGLIAPTGRIGDESRLHLRDALGVPEDN